MDLLRPEALFLLVIAFAAAREETAGAPFTLGSSAFAANGSIPEKYTCEGDDVSPALSWAGAPEKTKSLALVVADPDAPDPAAPKTTWTHWVLFDIPPKTAALPEGVRRDALPAGTREGRNDWGKTGWGGPCPPIGRHRYIFTLYALDTLLPDLKGPDRAALEKAIAGHTLGKATLIGTYQKKQR